MKSAKIKIFAVFSNVEYANEFYWYAKYIDKNKFELHCIFLNSSIAPVQKEISVLGVACYYVHYCGKKNIFSAFIKIIKLLIKIKPDIIHPQLFDASLLTLTAAWILGFKKRVHTRHHAELHHAYHPHAVKYDKWINYLSKKIICPTTQTKNILIEKENVAENKITVIKHGFDFMEFEPKNKENLIQKYQIQGYPIIGVVSRFTELKGIQYVIPAFEKFLKKYDTALLLLVGANGDYSYQIKDLLKFLPQNSFRLISFEKDIYSLFSTFHIFVHVPVSESSESFGQVYVESFALAVPSIITLSGIATEVDIFSQYAEVVNYRNSEQIYESIIKITENYSLYKHKMQEASVKIQNIFNFEQKIRSIENCYFNLLNVK